MMRRAASNKSVSSTERELATRRRGGVVLVAALVCMAIVLGIVGSMLQGALRARRQLHAERDLRQTELLLDAGVDRAANKLAEDTDYVGETWKTPASEVLGAGTGEVVIEVTRPGDSDSWNVHVAAEYPAGAQTSVRRARTFSVHH
jgi:hypothetical protein